MRDISVKFRNLALTLFLFFLVFQPPLIASISYLLVGAMLLFCVLRPKVVIDLTLFKPLYGFIPFFFYLIVSTLVRVAFSTSREYTAAYWYNLRHVLLSAVFLITGVLFLSTVRRKRGDDISHTLEVMLVAVGLMQLACTLLAVVFPSVHRLFMNLIVANARNDTLSERALVRSYRVFIFSSYIFDLSGFVCSFLTGLTFIKGLAENSNKYKILGLMLIIISVFNSRTGLLLSVIAIAFAMLFYLRRSNPNRVLLGALGVIFMIPVALIIIRFLPKYNREWIYKAMMETYRFLLTDEDSGTYKQILGVDIVFPKNLVFGLGARPESLNFYAKDGSAIDNGYLQVIWRFGLVGLVLLVFGIAYYYIFIYRSTGDTKLRCICFVFSVIVFAYYMKTYPMTIHGANFIAFVFPILLLKENRGLKNAPHLRHD